MEEKLLHYIWTYQCLHKRPLYTTLGEKIEIIRPGRNNPNAGPDFLGAHIRIGSKKFHGSIEVDRRGHLWRTHGHHQNRSYNDVVLHVVWEDEQRTINPKGEEIPSLKLCDYVAPKFLSRYEALMHGRDWVPCQGHLPKLSTKQWQEMIEKAAKKRLKRKGEAIIALFKKNQEDSEATAYQVLASCLGGKINSAALLMLCQEIPRAVIDANRRIRFHLEALLLGKAGLLNTTIQGGEPYEQDILQKYGALTKRYKLSGHSLEDRWKFLRLRPAHFPTIRIAQLCALLHEYDSIFYLLINQNLEDMYKKLCLQQSHYWQYHYLFGKKSRRPIGGLGKGAVEGILINGVAPLLAGYGDVRNQEVYFRKGIEMLKHLPAEKNQITKKWEALGMPLQNAFDTQGALELFSQFCAPKKCLDCQIGQSILGKNSSS